MKIKRLMDNLIKLIHPRIIKNKLLHFALKGNTVECPCCGYRYLTFLPAGLQKRPNAKCIKCGLLERHRMLWLYLHEQGNFFSSKIKMLHIAREKQLYQKLSKLKNIDIILWILILKIMSMVTKRKGWILSQLGLPDNSFDVTIYNHVLEHVPDDMTAMKEMFRILKRDGWAIVNVPVNTAIEETIEDPFVIDHQERKKLFGQPDHVRAYGGDYVTRLRNAGFNVEVINYVLKFSYNEQFGMV